LGKRVTEDRLLSPDKSADELPEYRPLSIAAVLCLILAILSYAALVHYLFWIVPLLTVFVALLTIRHLNRGDTEAGGKKLAIFALILAAIPLAWAPAEAIVWRVVVVKQAREFADAWLQLVQDGEKKRAYYWMLSRNSRPRSQSSFLRYYRDEAYRDRMEEYFASQPIKQLLGNDKAQVKWVKNGKVVGSLRKCQMLLRYHADFGDGEHRDLDVFVTREYLVQGHEVHWEIGGISSVDGHRH
jgi:hypothetical protein